MSTSVQREVYTNVLTEHVSTQEVPITAPVTGDTQEGIVKQVCTNDTKTASKICLNVGKK